MGKGNWLREAEEQFERWTEELSGAEPPTSVSVPHSVLLTEALELAALVEACWEPKGGLPGMKELEGSIDFGARTVAEIRELHGCLLQAQARLALLRANPEPEPMADALQLLRELRDALQFLAATRQRPQIEATLDKIRETSGGSRSHCSVALELEVTASLAHDHLDELRVLPGFEATQIERAGALAVELRESIAVSRVGDREQQRLSELKGRFLALLLDRVGITRRAFRWVYRRHPEVAKLAAGDYHRQRRRERSGRSQPPPSQSAG